MASLQEGLKFVEDPRLTEAMGHFRGECVSLLAQLEPMEESYSPQDITNLLSELESHYRQLKAQLLQAGAGEQLQLRAMVAQLDLYSDLRRAMEQAVKGADCLHELAELASRYRQTTDESAVPV